MTQPRSHPTRRRPAVVALLAAVAVVLAACTPEPAPSPEPAPPAAGCLTGSLPPPTVASASDDVAVTVETAAGTQKTVTVADAAADAKVASLTANGKTVLAVEPVVPVSIAQSDAQVDDPFFRKGAPGGPTYGLWGLKAVDAPEAWGVGLLRQGQGTVVAVIDTGVQADHPGLAGRVLAGYDVVAGAPGAGTDANGHGTHIAGTIGEVDDTARGIGVAPQARILPVRVLRANGTGTSDDVAVGIRWAADHGADVINLSLGTGTPTETIRLALEYAAARGVVVVTPGGNNGACCAPTVAEVEGAEAEPPPEPPGTPATPAPAWPVPTGAGAPTPTVPTTTTTPAPAALPTTAAAVAPTTPTAPTPSAPTVPSAPVVGDPTSTTTTTTTSTSTTTASSTTTTTTTTTTPTIPFVVPSFELPRSLDSTVIEACSTTTSTSPPLYPAAYAGPGGPAGLLAVAATGMVLPVTMPAIGPGAISWRVAVGDFVEVGADLAVVGAQHIRSSVRGVLAARSVGDGALVVTGTEFAQLLSAESRAPYSNVNDYISIAAPGGGASSGGGSGIWSTLPNGAYGYKSGTSMAAPHVAAVAALVLAKCPSLTPGQVASVLVDTADDIGPPGRDLASGAGLVQADAAVTAAC